VPLYVTAKCRHAPSLYPLADERHSI
jgi:hypothetical protein